MTSDDASFVSWLHIGDVHASDEDGWESVARLERIAHDVLVQVQPEALAFAYLPGDNANHGEPEQYRQIAKALRSLPLPLYVVPGDHDFEPGSLSAFAAFAPTPLPYVAVFDRRRALFLDIVSAGEGGPDFRIGDRQFAWLQAQLLSAQAQGEPRPLVFMHAFPTDMRDGADVAHLFSRTNVAFVDTGHTHYNELIREGAVIYSATRSTGQIEEGPVGFSVGAVDGDAVSWRFKELDSPWPWVMVTSPADIRLSSARATTTCVRALVLGTDVRSVELRIDEGEPIAMHAMRGRVGGWSTELAHPLEGRRLRVVATDAHGQRAHDEVHLVHGGDRTDAWTEHGVLGTKLGPNAFGHGW